jgi:hypothetical protein
MSAHGMGSIPGRAARYGHLRWARVGVHLRRVDRASGKPSSSVYTRRQGAGRGKGISNDCCGLWNDQYLVNLPRCLINATTLVAGLYADSAGHPGALISQE